ncbi:alpha/beta hydrolase [Anabaena sp. UHCC 0451]|uniref:alpha/beta hydrolase n=1 Tax=Anabaena sp. UHCC 0451 TaxID=2055235 RepID=UPI002B1F0B06|nr:alpha/beta hydrolase [Anabaena sp. UHCC 0451]MEA5576295.1 alpha/beta hydrolase [Anabaena sp. UHCC 0451]
MTYLLNRQIILLKIALIICNIGLIPVLTINRTFGAERIKFNYGLLEESIPIHSLETYARTGAVDKYLAVYSHYVDKKQLTQLQKSLLAPIPLNKVQVSQFLYTPIGERLLGILGKVIQTESRLSGFYAIRAALILSAADANNFTLLNVLNKFPTNAILINLSESLAVVNILENIVNKTQNAVALINQQSQNQYTTDSPLNTLLLKDSRKLGSLRFVKQTITLNDLSRNRIFPADIYLPVAKTHLPIIVISHGLGSDRTSFAYLAEHLASYGFVVAVPEHPGSNAKQIQALLAGKVDRVTNPREFIDRPLDIKYLLDELTSLSKTNPTFRGRLNLEQVGVVGQSFGGYTALALAGAKINFEQIKANCLDLENTLNISLLLQCLAVDLVNTKYNLSDTRVKAIIAINPIDSSIFGQASLSQIKIPVMMVSGSADTVTPALPEQIQPFTWLTTPHKYLALINGGTHFSTITESSNTILSLPTQLIGASPALARSYVRALSVAFFQAYVAEQPSYLPYLSTDYVNKISQQPLPLSLIKSLTSEQL